ncbi:altered inheritance of mitochondria protein 3-like isoform X2 [Penaeus monodon]|uniref:altered inheritance of mitochondria protein 3-like isoform X2 n=1 Tax=Penaeus monodon TaxID=6687 RepID=UPI0018A7093C|nr:altered inheritance of mitochondria protein 3-like isoform X2 [Penaeus monodon]
MECYQNGGTSSLQLSASNLPPPLTRTSQASSSPSSRLSSPHDPSQRLSPQDAGSPLSFREIPRCPASHEASPRLSPQRGAARLSFHEGAPIRLSSHEGGPRMSPREYSSRLSHESLPRLSPHEPVARHLPHAPGTLHLSPHERRLSPHEGPPRMSPQEQHAHRMSPHDPPSHMAPHDPPSHMSPPEHAHRASPPEHACRMSSQEHIHRMSPQEHAHRASPRDSASSRMSSRESSPRQSPRDRSPRSSVHEAGPLLPPHDPLPRRPSRESVSQLLIHEPLPRIASRECVPRVASRESPAGAAPHEPRCGLVHSSSRSSAARPPSDGLSNHRATQHAGPESPRLSRRETDLSLNHVRLQETYINVETLEEREAEKQLSQAWKRKRRRSVEATIPEYLKSAPLKRVTHQLEESVLLNFLTTITEAVLTCVISVPLSLALLLALPFAVVVIDASMNLKRIKQLLASRVVEAKNGAGGLMYPRLTQMVSQVPGGPAWVHDHNFNLHNHVFSGPSITTEEALQKYVSSLLSQPLPPSRPLWEVIVLHDYGRSHDTVLVCRLHQCISDGMSLVRVLCQSLSDNQIMHIPQKPHFGGMTYGMNLIKAALVGPLTTLTWLWWWRPELNPLTVKRGAAKPRPRIARSGRASCCGCNREIASSSSSDGGAYTVWGEDGGDGQLVLWSAGVSMNRVVRIKQVTRTCLNDVLLAALSGALRVTMQRQGVLHPPDLKVRAPSASHDNTGLQTQYNELREWYRIRLKENRN